MKRFSAPVIVIIVATIISIAWFAYHTWAADVRTIANNREIERSVDLINKTERLNFTIKAMESAVRGFVITGDTGLLYSEEYMYSQLQAPVDHIASIGAYDERQAARIDELKTAVIKKMAFFRYVIHAARETPITAGALLQSKSSTAITDEVEQICYQIVQAEHFKINARLTPYWDTRIYYFLSLSVMIICFGSIVFAIGRLIRERKKVRKVNIDLRISEQKYRQLVEGSGVTIFSTNRGGFFTYVSSKAFELTGYTPEELEGKQYLQLIDPSQQKEIRTFYERQAYEGPLESTNEFTIIRKNGEKRWVEQQVTLQRNKGAFSGYQCVVKDIHHRKMIQQELEHTQNEINILNYRMQSILHNSPAIIYIKDMQGRYLLVNKRFGEATGIADPQIIGRTDREFPDILQPERNMEIDRDVLLNEQPVEMEEIIMKDGVPRYFYVIKFPLRDHTKRVYALCGIATDITERIANEHAILAARKRAEAAKQAQEMFMANMSHEIRTPLNGIIGNTNLLQQTEMAPEQQEFLSDIKASANNLLTMVDALLDFSRIRSGKLALTRTDFDLHHVIQKVVMLYLPHAQTKGLQLHATVDPNISKHLLGDPLRVQQVLENLVDNAIKFTEKGRIDLEVQLAQEAELTTTVSFALRDTGIGIPEHLQQEIWEAFAQVQHDNDRKHGGAGLGLTLARQLVKLHNGDMTIANNEGGGTIIRFSIPFGKDVPVTTNSHEFPPLHGKKILLAEDNMINQKVAKRTLEQAGAQADIAVNGKQAVEMACERTYDLILMDIQMPEMDGLHATRLIRERGSGIPIIAMTASALKGDRERFLLAGMNEYISKPFIPNQLYQKILETLGERDPSFAPFKGEDYEEQKVAAFIDLRYLRDIADDDKEYMYDVLSTFLERTSNIFNNLVHSAQQQHWEEVYRHASLLRSSLSVVRIFPLLDMVITIEQQARLREDVGGILPNVHMAIKTYNDAQDVIKKELDNMQR